MSEPVKKDEPKDAVERALDSLKPVLTQMGVGGIMGYCTGMALKKVGKTLATILGLGFVGLQSAAYAGYIEVNWKQVGNDVVIKRMDSVSLSLIFFLYFELSGQKRYCVKMIPFEPILDSKEAFSQNHHKWT